MTSIRSLLTSPVATVLNVHLLDVAGIGAGLPVTKKRGQAHLREKGIVVDKIEGLSGLSREDERAVEQALIEYHGLSKNGNGTLMNKKSISKVTNQTKYESILVRGFEILKSIGCEGF